MKVQLDTGNKIITLLENVNLKDLYEFMKATFPESWLEYNVCYQTKVEWTNPIYIDRYPYFKPWWEGPIYTLTDYKTGTGGKFNGNDGLYTSTLDSMVVSNHNPSDAWIKPGIYNLEINN